MEQVIDGEAVERRRHALHWTMRELAERAGVSERTVWNAEQGRVGKASAAAIESALAAGEAAQRAKQEPPMTTSTFIIEGPHGPVTVTVTGDPASISRLDMRPLVRDILSGE
jgi:DNA-binding XRE family transcriptional regulator